MNELKTKRKQKGLTQIKLAALTDMSQANISWIETSVINPTEKNRKKLETVLGAIDWSACEKYKLKPITKNQAELKIKELMGCLLGLSDKNREDMVNEVTKQLKAVK